jgi:hypothetical protein
MDAIRQSAVLAVVATGLLIRGPFAAAQESYVEVEAASGEPFGVAHVSVRPSRRAGISLEQFTVEGPPGKVLYPAEDRLPIRGLVREVLNVAPRRAGQYFLFRGNEPFEITVYAPEPVAVTVRPQASAAAHARLLTRWWREYVDRPGLFRSRREADYPQYVESYLTAMLARRLNLEQPPARPGLLATLFNQPDWDKPLGTLTGSEDLLLNYHRQIMSGSGADTGPADQPLPELPPGPNLVLPEAAGEVEIEPIALHVPVECFYIRSGSIQNQMWLRRTLERFGGDLSSLIAVRGQTHDTQKRLEWQLAMRDHVLVDLLGPVAVSDVALIGTDPFVREGGAVGMLMEARNSNVLSTDMRRQRLIAMKEAPDAKEEEIEIAGHKVSYISTPDSSIRSFYAVDGGYHLVTTSRVLVERFYQAGQGKGSLGGSAEFKYARSVFPLSRNDTAFAYFSDAFFENLASARYRIEMARRTRALAQLQILELARLASKAEGQPQSQIAKLIEGGFLPPGFGVLADGSRAVDTAERMTNSVRGRRGAFVPVPDVELNYVTKAEAAEYEEFAQTYRRDMQRMDPLMVAVKRSATGGGRRELVEIDLRLAPFTHRNWLDEIPIIKLGPPDTKRLDPVEGDLVALELNLATTHAFAGLRDLKPLPDSWRLDGRRPQSLAEYALGYLRVPLHEYLFGYLGGSPDLGALQPTVDALEGVLIGSKIHRSQSATSVLLSLQPAVLETVEPQLKFQENARPAQARLRIGDLSRSNLASLLDTLGFIQARRTSQGNLHFLELLTRQLHVPPEQALEVAQEIANARLVCSVGGTYELRKDDRGRARWVSTALADEGAAGREYQFPPLEWLRGLDLEIAATHDQLAAHALVEMQLPENNNKTATRSNAAAPKP